MEPYRQQRIISPTAPKTPWSRKFSALFNGTSSKIRRRKSEQTATNRFGSKASASQIYCFRRTVRSAKQEKRIDYLVYFFVVIILVVLLGGCGYAAMGCGEQAEQRERQEKDPANCKEFSVVPFPGPLNMRASCKNNAHTPRFENGLIVCQCDKSSMKRTE